MRRSLKPLIAIWLGTSLFFFWLIGFRLSIPEPDNFYGMQTEALLAGHLRLNLKPNPVLATLENPYKGEQNQPYRVQDLSYYHGHYYSYFGVGPILYLLLPWRVVTGQFLRDVAGTTVLAVATDLAALLVLLRLRRFYPHVGSGSLAMAYLLLCLGTWHSIHLVTVNSGTIAQEGAYCWLTVAFFCLLLVFERANVLTVAALSLACGAAVASRPSFLPCVALLGPLLFDRRLRRAPLWVAAALPVSAIIAGLLWYNHARFGAYFEFGNRLQLTDTDVRNASLMSAKNIGVHWRAFLFRSPTWVHFFPFLNLEKPIGLLWACPAVVLGLGGVVYLRRERPTEPAEFFVTVLVTTLGLFGLLAAFQYYLYHYSVDFFLPAMWVAVLGWFALIEQRHGCRLWSRLVRLAGTVLTLATVLFAVLYTLGASPQGAADSPLSWHANRVVAWVDSLKGVAYGEVRVRGKLDRFEIGKGYPLVSAGVAGSDVCYVTVLEGGRAQVGILQMGMGPLSAPFAFDPKGVHDYRIAMGGLLPPAAHPFYQGWTAGEIAQATRLLRVVVDEKQVLVGYGGSSGSEAGRIVVGSDPARHGIIEGSFPGELSVRRAKFVKADWTARAFPRVTGPGVRVTFLIDPIRRTTWNEPLLSVGSREGSFVVYLKHQNDGLYHFGLDRIGYGAVESKPIALDAARPHVLTFLAEPGANPTMRASVDDTLLFELNQPLYPATPDEYFYGVNTIGSGIVMPAFQGAITGIDPLPAAAR